jgi:hypothetical protein
VLPARSARGLALALLCGAVAPSAVACADPPAQSDDAVPTRPTVLAQPRESPAAAPSAPSAPAPERAAGVVRPEGDIERAAGVARPEGDIERALATARIAALAPTARRGRGAAFRAQLDHQGTHLEATVLLAPRAAQSTHRRALAYARLAGALGFDVAAPVGRRRIGVGELGALTPAASHPVLERTVAIHNDGTVDALLEAAPPSGAQRVTMDGAAPRTWQRWAASPTPLPGEEPRQLRGWVELLVLDWLAGNAARRGAWLDTRSGRLATFENAAAFPQRYDARATDPALARLREVVRFPTGMHAALRRLDRDTARDLFNHGDFQGWLLPPRSLVALDERRLTLLSLLEARFAEHGRAAVESL